MNKKMSSETVLLIVSGIVAVLLVMLIVMKVTHMNATTKDIEAANITLSENQTRLVRLMQLDKIKPMLEKTVAVLNRQIPQQPDEARLISQLEASCMNLGSQFLQVQFEERTKNNNITEMPMKLSFSGEYAALVDIVSHMANGERLMRIDKIQITKSDPVNNQVRADIEASSFCK